MRSNLVNIVTVGTKQPFNAEGAMKAARGFHGTAALLEDIHKRERVFPKGTNFDLDMLNQLMGRVVSATVLEALALELVLKVRLNRAGVAVSKEHSHAKLFAELPETDKQEAEDRYQAQRHPAMRATLEEVLTYSANVFEKWRYLHEHPHVEASMGEMQRAFESLADVEDARGVAGA
jgi:hypothetical protein